MFNTEYRDQRRTNVHAHLPIVFVCPDVIIKCGQKVANIEKNGLSTNRNGQFVIAICRIISVGLSYLLSLFFK